MKIKYHRVFVKNFRKRIAKDSKLTRRFEKRMEMFVKNVDDPVLRNHRLVGRKREYWSFRVTGDIRVVYKRVGSEVWLYDIGSHNQVY